MGLQMCLELQEARVAYDATRKEAGMMLGCSERTLEAYEYGKIRTPMEVIRRAAEMFSCPELLDQAWNEYPQEWPRIPLPERIETSLLANAAKAMKEAQEETQAMQKMALQMYGKECGDDLTQEDRKLVAQALREGAESVRAFKNLCSVLVKQYGYSIKEIDHIIAQGLAVKGQKNKAAL
jgi:DNA-binding XRE family transcriptional regulator